MTTKRRVTGPPSEFEQQVAEALMPPDVGLRAYPDQRKTVVKVLDIAPRVAAAIRATREKCAELTSGAVTLAHVHGARLPADALQQVEAAALDALRKAGA